MSGILLPGWINGLRTNIVDNGHDSVPRKQYTKADQGNRLHVGCNTAVLGFPCNREMAVE